MYLIRQFFVVTIQFSLWVTAKQIRFADHLGPPDEYAVHQQSVPSAEYQPIYGGSPDQDLSAESVGVEFEDTVIRSMLQIVDVKFNTLSTRILSLERGINSLQVYLSRQFRHVTKNLQAVNIVMNSLHAEVSHVDMETRSVRNSIFALNKEFLDYRNKNLGVFRELPPSGQRAVPTDDPQMQLNQSRQTEKRDIGPEYADSDRADAFSPRSIGDGISDGFSNYTRNSDILHKHIEKGFSLLNQTIEKRFDRLDNITEVIYKELGTVQERVTAMNNTFSVAEAGKNTMQDGLSYLKSMMDYISEKQDTVIQDVLYLKERVQHGNTVPKTSADKETLRLNGPLCPQNIIPKTEAVDFKLEFDKISEKLEVIDHRAEELNDNLVSTSEVLEASRNHTEHVVKLVEALSSTTIWIPHILREVKLTAKYLNESINTTYLVYKQVLGRRSDVPPGDQHRYSEGASADALAKGDIFQSSRSEAGSPCKMNDQDTKLIRQQISMVEEILDYIKVPNISIAATVDETRTPNTIHLLKKEVKGNTTSGILGIQSLQGLLHVCYDESESTPVANIACTQLDFSFGSPLIVPNILKPSVNLFRVKCSGKEANLDFCKYEIVSADDCKDVGLLGVFCVE